MTGSSIVRGQQEEQREFKKVPAGMHRAVCDMVAYVGKQPSTFKGETKMKPKHYIRWQVPDHLTDEGLPMVIGSFWTTSLHENSIMLQSLQSWSGRIFTAAERAGEFDLATILGAPCQIQVVHREQDGKTYANVINVVNIGGMDKPEVVGEKLPLIYDPEGSPQTWEDLPAWIQEKAERGGAAPGGSAASEASQRPGTPETWSDVEAQDEDPDDDIPF